MNGLGYAIGRQTLGVLAHREPMTFTLLGREWEKHAGVFGGQDIMEPTGYLTSWLPLGEARTFLEMGCGTGVTAVMAALNGCPSVTAVDVNPAAARNAEANARRHGVADRVRTLRSDLFEALGPDERFDLIYWNSPFIEAPPGRNDSYEEFALFDPGYSMHRAFLRDAPGHLTGTGRLFLGFSAAAGNRELLDELGREAGFQTGVHRQVAFDVPHEQVGAAPEFAAHADEKGMLHLDITLLEFRR
ncbi:methyltransferase [Actinomadura fibrosa]|uniref:Methyltransferase n=1 Tax=Actinomadura fibrosa TaxID=111802 RepID=A0ABW2Y2E5_9ACTN|nr:methyltransferase [Actinomadura fibrosa]